MTPGPIHHFWTAVKSLDVKLNPSTKHSTFIITNVTDMSRCVVVSCSVVFQKNEGVEA